MLPGVSLWSRWQPDRALFFNGWYVHGDAGAMLVDPLDPDADVLAAIDARALDAIVITNRDHERAAAFYAERYRAPVIAAAPDADELSVSVTRRVAAGDEVCGWRVVPFAGLKTAGEFALFDPATRAAIVGDAVWGVPAGALRLMPEEKLADPDQAALSLRRLLSLDVRHLLTGDASAPQRISATTPRSGSGSARAASAIASRGSRRARRSVPTIGTRPKRNSSSCGTARRAYACRRERTSCGAATSSRSRPGPTARTACTTTDQARRSS
jgi:glyoxylase-like metal-dependent hydrolase (beta-lactamase superfamily II)